MLGTYAAFCRNHGDYSTGAAGYHNWNEEAISDMASDAESPWPALISDLQVLQANTCRAIEEALDESISQISRWPYPSLSLSLSLCVCPLLLQATMLLRLGTDALEASSADDDDDDSVETASTALRHHRALLVAAVDDVFETLHGNLK